jgi:hypothetical protein
MHLLEIGPMTRRLREQQQLMFGGTFLKLIEEKNQNSREGLDRMCSWSLKVAC